MGFITARFFSSEGLDMVNSTHSTKFRGTINGHPAKYPATGWRLFGKRIGSRRENRPFHQGEICVEAIEQWFTESSWQAEAELASGLIVGKIDQNSFSTSRARRP
jgi:hypothetical protein